MVDYNARKASSLPQVAEVTADDKIMLLNEGAPPDLVLASVDALAVLAGSHAPAGPTGLTGPTGPTGPAGRDLAVKGTVVNFAALSLVPSPASGDTYVTSDDGKLWVYGSGSIVHTANVTTAWLISNVVTITCSAVHNMVAGQTVVVAGLTPTFLNGTYAILRTPNGVTIEYALVHADVASTPTGGTITTPATGWTAIATAIGPAGPTGAVGPAGPAGSTGPQGVQGPAGVGIAGANVPVGVILDYAGTSAPTGFLMCDGTEKDAALYPQLAALMNGSGWAQAAKVGFFRLPNLNGRVTVGIDPEDAFFGVVGKTIGGSKHSVPIDHKHSAGDLAFGSHDHTVDIWSGYINLNHGHTFTTDGAGAHNHGIPDQSLMWRYNPNGTEGATSTAITGQRRDNIPHLDIGNHQHTGTTNGVNGAGATWDIRVPVNGRTGGSGGAVTGTTAAAGFDGTNRNVQPFAVVSKIIRATV